MIVDAAEIRPRQVYQHLINLITPRPIAWVSTASRDGVPNLAPYSFFNGVGSRPPSLLFCPANRINGEPKDTLKNVEQTGEFVVNIVSENLTQQMHDTAAEYDFETSEFATCGLTAADSEQVKVPRVLEAKASIECKLLHSLHLETGPGAANVVIGRIVIIRIDDEVIGEDGFADAEKMDTVGRMGFAGYTRTRDRFFLPTSPVKKLPKDEA